LSTPN
jgi:hypothetical protein